VYTDHVGASVCIAEDDRDRHLAAQRGIFCFELVYLDEQLVRHELDEAAVIGVGAGSRLAYSGRRVVGEEDPECAALAPVEFVDVGSHAGRHFPFLDRLRVDQSVVDPRARRVHVAANAGRVHHLSLSRLCHQPERSPVEVRASASRSLSRASCLNVAFRAWPNRRRLSFAAAEPSRDARSDRYSRWDTARGSPDAPTPLPRTFPSV
jgi:hypothetical protein